MFSRTNLIVFGTLVLLFVALGDRILPDPLGSASATTRKTLNQALVNLFPTFRPPLDPHERTEDAIQQQQRRPNP
ncbi:hypothetical protein GS597_15920 [Synechococcales cyanobacterium C]|uniref:Uncharacterized protein n=1 Tax=Petrachloros mirabilis ULC683 TaxID=2781853 RepID=A0A8K2A1C9_9CYAN|nr:hypothetical protein [Petrachloros mirabilis]NCJ07966.1 hypothetical protein [Petrachloros mirabilis ULC683]